MMKVSKLLLKATLVLSIISAASAGTIVYESFDYPTGDVNGNTADSGLGAWSAAEIFDVVSGGLTYTNAAGNELIEKGNRMKVQWGGNMSAIANINIPGNWSSASTDGTTLNKTNAVIWWSMIVNYYNSNSSSADDWIRVETLGGGYFGLQSAGGGNPLKLIGGNDDGTNVTSAAFTPDLLNNPTFIVMKLDTDSSGNTTFSAWVDPLLDDESSLGAADASITVPADADGTPGEFNRIRDYESGNNKRYPEYDEIRMGESFDAVTPIPPPKGTAIIIL